MKGIKMSLMVKHVITKEQKMCLFIFKIVHLYTKSLLAQNKFEDEKMVLYNYENVAKITVWGGNTAVKSNHKTHVGIIIMPNFFQSVKEVGRAVIRGTLNLNGALHIQITKIGSNAALSQIVSLVETAQMAKAPYQKFADYIANFLFPSLLHCFLWHGWAGILLEYLVPIQNISCHLLVIFLFLHLCLIFKFWPLPVLVL